MVTIANVWLPHRLGDITEIIEKYITTNKLDYSSLAPSFPTGGIIINKDELKSIYETGKGRVILRAKTTIVDNKIQITELPYQVYIEPLIAKIKEMIKGDSISGISGIANKTDKKRLLIEIECDDNPLTILNELFKKTDLQKTYNANQWALVNKTPVLLTLKDYLNIYIDHNLACIRREFLYDIDQAKAKLEIVLGLIKALEDIDNIIALIKQSESSTKAEEALKTKYEFSDAQAKAIVNMRLGKLAHLEKIELNKEKEELTSTISKLENLLSSQNNLKSELLNRLKSFTAKYDAPRKTQVINIDISKEKKEKPIIEPKDCIIIINNKNMIKRIDATAFKPQKRNTVGTKHNDNVTFSQKTNTQDTLMIFSSKGKMYRILVDNIPEGNSASIGTSLTALIEFEDNEVPMAYTTLTRDTDRQFIFFATKNGIVKKVPLEEYDNVKRTGVLAIKLKESDELATITFTNQEQIMLVTKNGMCIRFDTKDMPISSRTAQGVKGIKLNDGDYVIAALPILDASSYLAIVSENGLGKKTALDEFSVQGRAGKGVICYKGKIAGATIASEDDSILVNGNTSSIVINVKDIPTLGKTSMGNLMIKNNKKIISVAKV